MYIQMVVLRITQHPDVQGHISPWLSQWFHFPRSAKELTPEAGHAEVFAEAQRVEWMLTQRRSLQDAR